MLGRFYTADNYQYSNIGGDRRAFIENEGGNSIVCRGRVIEVEHHEVFHSKFHKIINSIVCGEPYQFAHQTAEYLIRVEEPSHNGAGQIADFFLYGNYIGRLYPGDEVEIRAKNSGHRYVAERIFNVSTNSQVRPGLQVPAIIIRGVTLLVLIIFVGLALSIYGMAQTGELMHCAIYGGIVIGGLVWFKNWLTSKIRRK